MEISKKMMDNPDLYTDEIGRPVVPDMECPCSKGKVCDNSTFKNLRKKPKSIAQIREALLSGNPSQDIGVGTNPNTYMSGILIRPLVRTKKLVYLFLLEMRPGTMDTRNTVVEVHNFDEKDDIPLYTPLEIFEPEVHIY